MATFQKFQQFIEDVFHGVHDFSSDTFKIVLTNTEPDPTDEVLADITQIAGGNGYTTGGAAITITGSGQALGTYKLEAADRVFTASGGTIGPFQWAALYNDTPSSPADPLVGWWEYPAEITLQDGETFTVDFDASAGVFTAA